MSYPLPSPVDSQPSLYKQAYFFWEQYERMKVLRDNAKARGDRYYLAWRMALKGDENVRKMEYVWLFPTGELCDVCLGLDMTAEDVVAAHSDAGERGIIVLVVMV